MSSECSSYVPASTALLTVTWPQHRCSEPARFMIQRDDWPQMFYCGNDLACRVELYRKQGREITCSEGASLTLEAVGLEVLL